MALGVIAIAMALFIVFVERRMLSTGELEARRHQVIRSFVRSRVTDVEIHRGQMRIVLHREREEDLEAFEVGHWVLTDPIASDADQDAVDGLLSALEWLQARRTLDRISADDRRRFGLEQPRATVRFKVADREVTVAVGDDDPRGDGVYVGVSEEPDRAWVVGRDVLEALEHDVDHFRRKELFARFQSTDATAIELRNAEIEARLEKEHGRWWLRRPVAVLARTTAVEALFELVRDLKATRFLSETLQDTGSLGLDPPSRELTIERQARSGEGGERDQENRRSNEEAERDRSPLRLRIGGPCPGHPDERIAVAGEGPVTCVLARSLEALDVGLTRLQESRLVAMRDSEFDRAEIRVGTDRFELRGDEHGERYRLLQGEQEMPADREAITDWLRELRAQEAMRFEAATDAAIAARGLASPRATVILHALGTDRIETLSVGYRDAEGVWVRRGEEPQIALFPAAAAELLTPAVVRFRNRQLVREREGNARRMRIVRGDEEERLERDGTDWKLTAPDVLAADRVVARDVVRAFSNLTAVRFVAERASAQHALDRPRIVVTATFEGPPPPEPGENEDGDEEERERQRRGGTSASGPHFPRDIVLRIGAPTEGGAFAQLGSDPTVFVVGSDLVEKLEGPLVSRDLLATETSDLETLAIVRVGQRIELRREGDRWMAGPAAADPDRTTRLLDRLASLRATGTTRWGPAPPEHGFGTPTLILEVVRRVGEPRTYRIEVGAAGATGTEGWYHARRSDLQVGFRLGSGVVQEFLEYQP
jgi:hypothetical protein